MTKVHLLVSPSDTVRALLDQIQNLHDKAPDAKINLILAGHQEWPWISEITITGFGSLKEVVASRISEHRNNGNLR